MVSFFKGSTGSTKIPYIEDVPTEEKSGQSIAVTILRSGYYIYTDTEVMIEKMRGPDQIMRNNNKCRKISIKKFMDTDRRVRSE